MKSAGSAVKTSWFWQAGALRRKHGATPQQRRMSPAMDLSEAAAGAGAGAAPGVSSVLAVRPRHDAGRARRGARRRRPRVPDPAQLCRRLASAGRRRRGRRTFRRGAAPRADRGGADRAVRRAGAARPVSQQPRLAARPCRGLCGAGTIGRTARRSPIARSSNPASSPPDALPPDTTLGTRLRIAEVLDGVAPIATWRGTGDDGLTRRCLGIAAMDRARRRCYGARRHDRPRPSPSAPRPPTTPSRSSGCTNAPSGPAASRSAPTGCASMSIICSNCRSPRGSARCWSARCGNCRSRSATRRHCCSGR